jgi:hypothetical protein
MWDSNVGWIGSAAGNALMLCDVPAYRRARNAMRREVRPIAI